MKKILSFAIILILLAACSNIAGSSPESSATPTLEPSRTSSATSPPAVSATPGSTPAPLRITSECGLDPIIVPTRPAKIPASTQLDETTGLHMTGTVQEIDLATYRLKISGLVEQSIDLTLDELRCLPKVTASAELTCTGVFRDSGTWSGVPIRDVLELAGVLPGSKTVQFVSADGYKTAVSIDTALNPKNFLAYEMQGKPLPILHGFPLRAVLPDTPGNKWVKWLIELVVG